jgi:hypothetical protein
LKLQHFLFFFLSFFYISKYNNHKRRALLGSFFLFLFSSHFLRNMLIHKNTIIIKKTFSNFSSGTGEGKENGEFWWTPSQNNQRYFEFPPILMNQKFGWKRLRDWLNCLELTFLENAKSDNSDIHQRNYKEIQGVSSLNNNF